MGRYLEYTSEGTELFSDRTTFTLVSIQSIDQVVVTETGSD